MKRRLERGAQIIEFALVLPLLLLILLLVIDFGFLVYNKAVITNASREAARGGAVLSATPWSTTNVGNIACAYSRNLVIGTKAGTRTATCSGSADPVIVVSNPNGKVPPEFGDPITVQVTYDYHGFLLNTASTWVRGIAPLTATTTMRHE